VSQCQLVAVSKTKPVEAVTTLYAEGQRHFGENYVQEIVDKGAQLKDLDGLRWHFIGNLQRNKAKHLAKVPNLFMVETIDSAKTATALNKAFTKVAGQPGHLDRLNVMVQVNTSGEEAKSGCTPAEVVDLAQHVSAGCPALQLRGLMTIGAFDDPHPEPYFESLGDCRCRVAEALGVGEEALELSMGMSGDFEKAIAMGSTSVRIGSTLFGARDKPAP
jgi:pyridoxal phosphate enzyme (YggS family)